MWVNSSQNKPSMGFLCDMNAYLFIMLILVDGDRFFQ